MSDQSTPKGDYSREPVPDHATVGGFKIAVVIFGVGVTLPVFFVGSQIAQALGFKGALIAFASACAALGALMIITSIIGGRTRLSTYMLLEFSFGRIGARLINLLLAITLIGFFAATADIFGGAVYDASKSLYGWTSPEWLITIIGCAGMSLTGMFGFRFLEKFSIIVLPLLGVFMIYVVSVAVDQSSWDLIWAAPGNGTMTMGEAITIIIGTNILMAVMAPDFTRFAKSDGAAVRSVLGLAVGYPIIMLASSIPTLVVGETDIMKIMVGLGIALPALYILVISTWTTNTVNIYSAILTLATIWTKTPEWKLGIWAAVIGTAGAVFGLMDYFLPLVSFLGNVATPVAGIYVADYIFLRRGQIDVRMLKEEPSISAPAFLSWISASAVALATNAGYFSLTGMSAMDAMISGFGLHLIFVRILLKLNKKKTEAL